LKARFSTLFKKSESSCSVAKGLVPFSRSAYIFVLLWSKVKDRLAGFGQLWHLN
jgi:hypothetical protein